MTMTQGELDAAYYVSAVFSAKDQRTEGSESILAEDVPVRLSVCGAVRGITIQIDNEMQHVISGLEMTNTEALSLIEKLAEQVGWNLRK